jgi:hypothetical protein
MAVSGMLSTSNQANLSPKVDPEFDKIRLTGKLTVNQIIRGTNLICLPKFWLWLLSLRPDHANLEPAFGRYDTSVDRSPILDMQPASRSAHESESFVAEVPYGVIAGPKRLQRRDKVGGGIHRAFFL